MAGDIGCTIVMKPDQVIQAGDVIYGVKIKRIIRIEERKGYVWVICRCKKMY